MIKISKSQIVTFKDKDLNEIVIYKKNDFIDLNIILNKSNLTFQYIKSKVKTNESFENMINAYYEIKKECFYGSFINKNLLFDILKFINSKYTKQIKKLVDKYFETKNNNIKQIQKQELKNKSQTRHTIKQLKNKLNDYTNKMNYFKKYSKKYNEDYKDLKITYIQKQRNLSKVKSLNTDTLSLNLYNLTKYLCLKCKLILNNLLNSKLLLDEFNNNIDSKICKDCLERHEDIIISCKETQKTIIETNNYTCKLIKHRQDFYIMSNEANNLQKRMKSYDDFYKYYKKECEKLKIELEKYNTE